MALQDALAEIAEGEGQRVIDMIAKAPPGPIKTKWGLAFRDYDEERGGPVLCLLLGRHEGAADRGSRSVS